MSWQFKIFLQSRGIDCSLPIAPLGTIGVAVAFYVGFKNSQSYDRFWEARKIWGGIVNVSRAWANQVITFISSHHSDEPVDENVVKQIHRSHDLADGTHFSRDLLDFLDDGGRWRFE